jgi:hypothetical protein
MSTHSIAHIDENALPHAEMEMEVPWTPRIKRPSEQKRHLLDGGRR